MFGGIFAGGAMAAKFLTTSVWQLALLHGAHGFGMGLVLPVINPMVARWATAMWPQQTSQASAIPMLGMVLGMMAGPMVFSSLIGDGRRSDFVLTFIVAGGMISCGVMGILAVSTSMNRQLGKKKKEDAPANNAVMKAVLDSGAVPEKEFIDEMSESLRQYLTEGSPKWRGFHAWHGLQQMYIRRLVEEAVPPQPTTLTREKMEGILNADNFEDPAFVAYIESVFLLFWRVMGAEERRHVAEKFPHLKLPEEDSVQDSSGACAGANMQPTTFANVFGGQTV